MYVDIDTSYSWISHDRRNELALNWPYGCDYANVIVFLFVHSDKYAVIVIEGSANHTR